MKKILALVLTFALVLTVTSCGKSDLAIGTLNGPTGIGLVGLMDDYDVSVYQSPTDVAAKLLNGDLDIGCVPSNLAAVLYAKSNGNLKCLATIALGNLYIVQKGSGQDVILAAGQGGTPEYVLKRLLPDAKVKWLANHSDVLQMLMKEENATAMLPEPFVTAAKGAQVTEDLNKLWKKELNEELPMGVLVCKADLSKKDAKKFLKDAKKSVEFVNDVENSAKTVVEKGFLANEDVAKKAIPGCKIVLDENSDLLKTFFEELYKLDKKSVGGKLPDEEFYY
ncbi:MAG: ABC transporter substrate-binding protein [Clostridia bacterium]|nr:ABC transporter substrate-binding protein [Clostridia bacterium]